MLLGYRAMHKKIKQEHNLLVPLDADDVMADVDPEGLKARGPVGVNKQRN